MSCKKTPEEQEVCPCQEKRKQIAEKKSGIDNYYSAVVKKNKNKNDRDT